jgi:folate-binding Fe-S cluster repair protein YgfZ
MRLLKVEPNGKFSLTDFTGKTIPPYTILSHTWGAHGEEVIFDDLVNGTGEGKPGYEKLKFCSKQTELDGLRYFWVDTCCINKADFTELSKSINSMFRWYSEAARCYVYLSDVPDPKDPTSTIETAFPASRWFKRGWTLQELIAPSTVQFFSRIGDLLGDKKSLEHQINQITGISIQVLQGIPLSQVDTAERLSWATRRETTVEEDAAYCLLGIFDIQMPLIYGEGRKKAVDRLQRKIQKSLIPPSSSSTDAFWIVPFERNPHFIGRKSQLAQLEEMLFNKDHTTRIAITGLGGVGKTQLVLELLHQAKDKYKPCSIIWIPATNMDSLDQAYLDVAQKLGIPGCEEEKSDVKKLVQAYLSKEHAGRWLLVFDNADEMDMWISGPRLEQGACGLIDYLPKSNQGCIIFTSRDRKTAVKLAQQNILEVLEMDEEMATQLLHSSLVNSDLIKNQQDTKALLDELTYLPLAIVQAAAYINENGLLLADYISLLKDQEEDVIELLSEDFEDKGRYRNIRNPVATTWLISFEQIRRRDSLAAEYLSFMSCIDPRNIPQSLLPPGLSRKKEIDAIGTLSAYSFISRRLDLALDLHRLVHLGTRNWLRKENLLSQSAERVMVRLEEILPNKATENRSVWPVYMPHVRYALESDIIDENAQCRVDLLWKYQRCLREEGRWIEAEVFIRQIKAMYESVHGQEHQNTLSSMNNLALTFWDQGRWKEAEELQVQVLETRKRILGVEHPDTLTSMNNLASTFWDQGRWKEAEELEVQVLETRKRILGAEHPNTLNSMNNLASTFRAQGRWKEAEELEVQVLETRKRILGVEHPDTLTSMNNLASTFGDQGRWKEAEELEVQVLETRKRILGAEHPDTLSSMNNLASTFRAQGRWKEAEELEVQVLETRKRILGAEHPNTLNSMNNLASTFRAQGRWMEAEELQVQVLETSKRILGAEHPDTLSSMNNLASTFRAQGRWKEAEELEVQVLETRKRILGVEHPDTLTSMNNLASTFWDQGRWKEAEELEVQVLETRKRILGVEHPDTLTSMNNLASTFGDQGRWKEAEELEIQVLETRKKILGVEHPDTLSSMNNLALTFWDQGRWKEAEELQVQVLETRKKILGVEHPDTLNSMNNLASTFQAQGRWKEAEELEVQVLETRKRILGVEHPDTLTSMNNLASTFGDQGRWKEAEELQVQVLETRKRILGVEHPDTLSSINNLASTFSDQGRWKEAEELEVQVLETRKRIFGVEHPDTLISMNNLASTFWNQGRWKEAEELEIQVLETRKRIAGVEHPDTLTSMNNLAFTWKGSGRRKEAVQLMEECVRLSTRILPPNHPDTSDSLAMLLQWQAKKSEIGVSAEEDWESSDVTDSDD